MPQLVRRDEKPETFAGLLGHPLKERPKVAPMEFEDVKEALIQVARERLKLYPGLAERFEEYALIRGDRVEERVRTYRGEGRCFP